MKKNYLPSIIILLLFETVGITLWLTKDNLFYVFNFTYIGGSIAVFLKPMSYFSLSRITCDPEKCISCGKCKKVCPMDVDMTDNNRSRQNGTDCILCLARVESCPKKALKF